MTTLHSRVRLDVVVGRPARLALLAAPLIGLFIGVLPLLGVSGPVALMPLAIVGLGAVVAISLYRFELVVLALIAIRPSLDALGSADLDSSSNLNVLVALFLVGMGAWWILRVGYRVPRLGRPIVIGIATLMIASAVATPGSGGVGMRLLFRLGGGLVPFIILLVLVERGETTARRLLATAMLSAAPAVVVGLIQLANGTGHPDFSSQRIYGTLSHPNVLGALVAVVGAAAVAVVMGALGDRLRPYAAVWLVCAIPVLVGTYTRGAWLAFAASGIVAALFLRPVLLAAVPVVVAVIVFAVPSVLDRVEDATSNTQIGVEESSSLAWRFSYWQQAIELTGNGRQIEGLGLDGIRQESTDGNVPHNEFIRFGVEAGIFGLISFFVFLGGLALAAVSSVRSIPRGDPRRAYAAAGCAAAVAALTFASNGNLLSQVTIMWPAAAAIVGGVAAAVEHERSVDVALPTPNSRGNDT